jgi:hypothetical protein
MCINHQIATTHSWPPAIALHRSCNNRMVKSPLALVVIQRNMNAATGCEKRMSVSHDVAFNLESHL